MRFGYSNHIRGNLIEEDVEENISKGIKKTIYAISNCSQKHAKPEVDP